MSGIVSFLNASLAIVLKFSVPISTGSPFDAERSLFQEMFNSQGSRPDFADDFLTRILNAVRLAEKDFYPVFEEVMFDL